MAAVKKSMAPKRKNKKQYALVHFTVEGWDGEFVAPDARAMSKPRILTNMQKGDLSGLLELFDEHDENTALAFGDMDDQEQATFFEAWTKASNLDSGKSGESSTS